MSSQPKAELVKKTPTGIEKLDSMLFGGIPQNSTVLLAGEAGTGKSNLALEWVFRGYSEFNEPGLYICLTESVGKMLSNAQQMHFFSPDCINPMQIHFTDLRCILDEFDINEERLDKVQIMQLIDFIANMMKSSGAKRVVIDSITALNYRLMNRDLIRTFFFELSKCLVQTDAILMAIGEVTEGGLSVFGVAEFLTDVVFYMYNERTKGQEPVRNFRIIKMRGSDFEPNTVPFHITQNGIQLFPKLTKKLDHAASPVRMPTGIKGLDEMVKGGIFKGSSTLITGSSGSGKTLLATRIIMAALDRGEKCIYFSFEESHDQIIRNLLSINWDLKKYEKQGNLKIISALPEECYLAEHAHNIIEAVDAFNAKYIVIDSISALRNDSSELTLNDTVRWISTYLKQQEVTIIYTNVTSNLMGAPSIEDNKLSTITDTIINLRFVEIHSSLKHGLLISKMRGSAHDKSLREFYFSENDIGVGEIFNEYEGILSGIAKKTK